MHKIFYKPSALKELLALDGPVRGRVTDAINDLAHNPRPPGCKKLKGSSSYRIRVGDWRVIYDVTDKILTVEVLRIGHRGSIYD